MYNMQAVRSYLLVREEPTNVVSRFLSVCKHTHTDMKIVNLSEESLLAQKTQVYFSSGILQSSKYGSDTKGITVSTTSFIK